MQALTFIFAFVAVLALILLVAWLVRRFAGNRLGTTANRGRMPRLAVIDAAAVDGRRRLVLVRRDNVEHLLMIGGPTDIVVESNIVRVAASREQIPQRPGLAAEPASPPRIAPLPDAPAWPDNEAAKVEGLDQPEPQITPMPELPTRPLRPAFGDDRRSMSAMVERAERAERAERRGDVRGERREPMAFPPEPLPGRQEPRQETRQELRQELRQEPRQEPRPEPRQESRNELRGEPRIEPRPDRLMPRGEPVRESILPRQLRPAEPPKPADPFRPMADRPITERPITERPITERSIADRPMAEPKAPLMRAPESIAPPPPPPPLPPAPPVTAAPPQQSAEANLAEMAQRLEAALRRPAGAEPQAPAEPAAEPPPLRPAARSESPAATPKTSFENLEDEMASLLGRPKSSS